MEARSDDFFAAASADDHMPSRRRAATTTRRLWVAVAVVGIVLIIVFGICLGEIVALNGRVDRARNEQVSLRASHVGRSVSFRLFPGDDLIEGIMNVVRMTNLRSAWVISCVGSLTTYAIRFANEDTIATGTGHFEIVSVVGTMTSITNSSVGETNGAWHLHISVADNTGRTIGGHLATGSTIFTTAEIQIGYDCNVEYSRGVDGATPWDELQIAQVSWC
jgi:predicted DNA-binding protein with PD1-like motif